MSARAPEVLSSPGKPLDPSVRAFVEPSFGYDFSHVRIHTGQAADRSAVAISARAYTVGSHVVFAAGQYAPQSTFGRRLLVHELTHVVQQGAAAGPVAAQPRRPPILPVTNPDLIQRDAELSDDAKKKACLAKVEESIQKLEANVAKPDYPLPQYIKDAVVLLRKKMNEGKVKCYAFSGIVHGKFKGDEIQIDGLNTDWINSTSLLHEAVHATHREKFPKAGKKYSESEGKEFQKKDPSVPDLLRWDAYTEYWAYRSQFEYSNPTKATKDRYSEEDLHKLAMNASGMKGPMARVREVDPDFDPRKWKPKG